MTEDENSLRMAWWKEYGKHYIGAGAGQLDNPFLCKISFGPLNVEEQNDFHLYLKDILAENKVNDKGCFTCLNDTI